MDILKEHLWQKNARDKTQPQNWNSSVQRGREGICTTLCEGIITSEVKKKEGKTFKECLDQEF